MGTDNYFESVKILIYSSNNYFKMVTQSDEKGVKEEISHNHLFMVTGLSSTNLEKLGQGL